MLQRGKAPFLLFMAASALLYLEIVSFSFMHWIPNVARSGVYLVDAFIFLCLIAGAIFVIPCPRPDARVTAMAFGAAGLLIMRQSMGDFRPNWLMMGILTAVVATARTESLSAPRAPSQERGVFARKETCAIVLLVIMAVHGVASVYLLKKRFPPQIDCFTFQEASVEALLHGENPYGKTEPNIYGAASSLHYYSPATIGRDGRVLVGLQYPPITLIAAVPGYLLGDVRYGFLIALLLSGGFIFAMMPDARGLVVCALMLLNPFTLLVEDKCWTEPLVWLFLCATVYASIRAPRWTPITAGLLLASKQYNIVALPLLMLLCPFPLPLRRTVTFFGETLAVVCITLLPFAFWNYHGLWHDLVTFHLAQPVRDDAHSLGVVYPRLQILAGPVAVGFCAWVILWARKHLVGFSSAYGLSLLLFFAFSKQAFANYYFLISMSFILSGALLWGAQRIEVAKEEVCVRTEAADK